MSDYIKNEYALNIVQKTLEYSVILFILFIIVAIIFIFNSYQLNKLHSTTYKVSSLSFVPIIKLYILGTIFEYYMTDKKLIGKYTKFLLLILPSFIVIPDFIGRTIIILWFIYLVYCKILFIKEFDNRPINYIFMLILPGITYKNCFNKILENTEEKDIVIH